MFPACCSTRGTHIALLLRWVQTASDLAPGFRFLPPSMNGRFFQTLGLPEAAAVAHALYAFQRKMLAGNF
jgi:hypothetical protein